MSTAGSSSELIELGLLRGSYGVQGWSHIQPHSSDSGVLQETRNWWLLEPAGAQSKENSQEQARELPRKLSVTGVRVQGAGLVAKWEGCDDPEAAQALKGWRVAVARGDFPALPPGQFYWIDLIGLQVENREGRILGTVQGLRNNGAHDVLEVAGPGNPILIPVVEAYVDGIDAEAKRIRVDWQLDW